MKKKKVHTRDVWGLWRPHIEINGETITSIPLLFNLSNKINKCTTMQTTKYTKMKWQPSFCTKMAPQMAATVRCSSVFVLFLFVFPVFCFSNTISFTRDDLLNIQQNTPHNLLPDFDFSDVLLDIVVGGAVALVKRYRRRRQGKRAGTLVKLRQCRFRTALPSIHLANLRSLPNKTVKLLLLSRTNKDFSNSAALCFTETWLNGDIPDSAIHLPNFQLIRADQRGINGEIARQRDVLLHQ